MRLSSPISLALLGGFAFGALAGCQTYDFEPVTPLVVEKESVTVDVAQAPPKPNMMLLVDKSGSMDQPITTNPRHPSCDTCRGDECPQATCPTRWAEMRKAMDAFLSDPAGAAVGRYGLAMFPEYLGDSATIAENQCNGTTIARLAIPTTNDVPAELVAAARNALDVITRIKSPGGEDALKDGTGGGTPTSPSLRTIGNLPALNADDNRQDIVILLTDGEPNCNPDNPISYSSNPSACFCSVGGGVCSGEFDRRGCLDATSSVDVVRQLNLEKNIRTVVIGFGAETTAGTGAQIMNRMAEVGGFPRRCDTKNNNSCGIGDTCNATAKVCGGESAQGRANPCATNADCVGGEECLEAPICSRMFYAAANSGELILALQEIAKTLGTDICEFGLAKAPEDMALLVVKLNDEKLVQGANTWIFEDGKVKFQGAACETIKAGNEQEPAKVNIQLVHAG